MRGWCSAIKTLQIGLCFTRLWNHSSYLQIGLLTLTCSITLAEFLLFILPASQKSPLFNLSLFQKLTFGQSQSQTGFVSPQMCLCRLLSAVVWLCGCLCNLALVVVLVRMHSALVWSEARCLTHFSVCGWWRAADELCCPRCSEGSHHTVGFRQQLLKKTLFF